MQHMADASFLMTLAIIFFGALLGSYLNGRRRDRCLEDFDGYHVTVEKKNGRIIWGILNLEPTGMELEYQANVEDQAHIETSYLLYQSEYKDLQAIYRYADELTPENQKRRAKSLDRAFHPGPLRVLGRRVRNFTNTATDSLSKALSFVTGQVKQKEGIYISEAGGEYLQGLGKDIIGYVGTSFDPLLEKYVGAKVVVEVAEGDAIYEYVGVLKDYSADFLEVLDVLYPQAFSVNLASAETQEELAKNISITFADTYKIQNSSEFPLLLHRIKCGDHQGEVNAVIGPGDEIELQALTLTEARTTDQADLSVFFEGLSDKEEKQLEQRQASSGEQETLVAKTLEGLLSDVANKENVQFDFKVIRLLDMIVPRGHSLVRHKAERYDPDQVFGEIGLSLRLSREEEEREAVYRESLLKDPNDIVSALGLSKLLVQQGRFEESIPLMESALEHRGSLVDHGRLVELRLQRVRKKLAARQRIVRG